MPKYDFNQNFIDFNGDAAKIRNSKGEEENYTYAKLAVDIMLDTYDGDGSLPGTEKIMRFRLAEKFSDIGEGSLKNYTAEELAMLTSLACKKQVATGNSRPTLVIAKLDIFINESQEEIVELRQ